MPDQVTVVYVMGMSRSGTTLFGELLGQAPGLFYAGEVRWLWRQLESAGPCGCGVAISDCPVWSKVVHLVVGSNGMASYLHRMSELQASAVGHRHTWSRVPRLLLGAGDDRPRIEYSTAVADVYRALLEATGDGIVIDTSSEVSDAVVLSQNPWIDFHAVHVVRDPLGVVFSHQRAESAGRPANATGRSAYLGGGWLAFNAAAELARRRFGPARCKRVRYEDLMRSPETTLQAVLGLVGQPVPAGLVVDGRARLAATHSAAGNPRRFTTGEVLLREDRAWESDLPALDRRIVRAISAPLARGYDYR